MNADDPVVMRAVLLEAADLIEQPGKWTQHMLARTYGGTRCLPQAEDAVCWCLQGAIYKVGTPRIDTMQYVLRLVDAEVSSSTTYVTSAGFNDTLGRTAAEVAALLRRAAERSNEPVV